jgi:hypothetical protein
LTVTNFKKTNNIQMINSNQIEQHSQPCLQDSLRFPQDTGLNMQQMNDQNINDQHPRADDTSNHIEYYIIKEPWEVEKLSKSIMASAKKETPILGIDCEGLAKSRRMQLIQVFYANKSYLIDIQAVNPFLFGFREVMESQQIMKIFHDFCEDASALICQFNVICNFVFDT